MGPEERIFKTNLDVVNLSRTVSVYIYRVRWGRGGGRRFCANRTQLISRYEHTAAPVQVYSSPEMWLYWRDLLPVQSGSADCCWRKIVCKYSLSYSRVLFYSMFATLFYCFNTCSAYQRKGIYKEDHATPPPIIK